MDFHSERTLLYQAVVEHCEIWPDRANASHFDGYGDHPPQVLCAQSLFAHNSGAASADKAALHIGAATFIHRFGSSLNEHVHFHVWVVDRVFGEVAGGADVNADMLGYKHSGYCATARVRRVRWNSCARRVGKQRTAL